MFPTIAESDLEFSAIRASGPGGQHVNKVSTAIQLRFNIRNSTLPDEHKEKLLRFSDQRITKDGLIVIKAQTHRSQDKNKQEAIVRLQQLVAKATRSWPKRVATRPSKASVRRRLDRKKKQSTRKLLRRPPDD